MEIGQRWAYRERGRMPLHEVEIVGLSKKPRPSRIKVRFFDDAFEGAEEWVPIGRLKAPWGEHPAFLADEERVDALRAAGSPSEAEDLLASDVFYRAGQGNFDFFPPFSSGIVRVRDVHLAARQTGLTTAQLTSHPLAYRREGVLLVPWAVSRLIMVALLSQNPRVASTLISEFESEIESERREFRMRHFDQFFAPTGEDLEHRLALSRDESFYEPMLDLLREIVDGEGNAMVAEHVKLRRKAVEHEALLLDVLQIFGHRHSRNALDLLERIRRSLELPPKSE